MPYAEQRDNQVILRVRVSPNAKHSGIDGVWNGTHLKIALSAPPVDGKANEALIEFLSDFLDLKKSAITLTSGQTARQKTLSLTFLSPNKASQALSLLTIR